MQKTLVITGQRGFIGLNFLKYIIEHHKNSSVDSLLDQYSNLILIDAHHLFEPQHDHMSEQHEKFLIELNELGIQVLEHQFPIRCLEPSDFKDVSTEGCDVVNFASQSHVDVSIANPFELYTSNANLVPQLIAAIGMDRIGKFWHIRTDEEFGHLEDASFDPFYHDSPINPRNPYAASKAAQSTFLSSLNQTFGLDVKFITLANQYGPFQDFSKMIPASINRVLNGDPILVYGTGTQMREWTFVEDTVCCIAHHMLTPYTSDLNTFISNPRGLCSNMSLVVKLSHILDKRGHSSMVELVEDRKGHDFCYKLDSDYSLVTPLDGGLNKTVDYYLDAIH